MRFGALLFDSYHARDMLEARNKGRGREKERQMKKKEETRRGEGRKEGEASLHRGLRSRKVVDLACVYY